MRKTKKWSSVNLFRHMTIRNKFIISNIILFGLCFGIVIISSFYKTSTMLISQTQKSVREELELIYVNITGLLNEAEHVSDSFFVNTSLCAVLSESKIKTNTKQIDDYYILKPLFSDVEKNYNSYKIKMYLPDEYIYSHEGIIFFPESEIVKKNWYDKVVNTYDGKILWVDDVTKETNTLAVVRVLKNITTDYKKLGVLVTEVKQSRIDEIFEQINDGYLNNTYIINNEGGIIAKSSNINSANFVSPEIINKIKEEQNEFSYHQKNENGDNLIIGLKIPSAEWTLVSVIPYNEIIGQSIVLRNYSILFSISIFVLSVFFSIFSLNKIAKRINTMSVKMHRIEEDNFEQLIEFTYNDEFSEIEEQYNNMCIRIRSLIDEVYTVEIKKKEAELRTLQSQINPHFLYNALDTINWMAVEYNAYDISKLAGNLGKFARLSLSKGKDIISLKDEIEITRLYLDVQKVRFGDCLEVEYDVETEIMDCQTLKLILQPIVENAIKHGFQSDKMRKGKIKIEGCKMNDLVHIEISDNGVGLNGQLNLNMDDANSDESGYGLKNITDRLTIYYKDKYKFNVFGEIGNGTTVILEWPYFKMNDH